METMEYLYLWCKQNGCCFCRYVAVIFVEISRLIFYVEFKYGAL